ncbi:MAG: DUF484 family protein [Rhodospirillaceae bacterium]|nr:DUF484 family protein [Rhodospirillaceae bacterium]MDD9927044.1 DUF484 family protein [Rhodospirillaceae bacterium]
MTQESTDPKDDDLTDERVAAYLQDNPDFLSRNPDVLRMMAPPDRNFGDGVSDIQTAMIGQLRTEIARLNARQDEIILTSRANLNTQGRVHECVVALLAAKSFEQAMQIVTTDFAVMLDLDVVTLCIEAEEGAPSPLRMSGLRMLAAGGVEATMGENKRVRLHSDAPADPEIFGGGATLVRSAAFIRLDISGYTPPALIAFGARRPGKFHAGQGTELLNFLGRVVEHDIRLWLSLPG